VHCLRLATSHFQPTTATALHYPPGPCAPTWGNFSSRSPWQATDDGNKNQGGTTGPPSPTIPAFIGLGGRPQRGGRPPSRFRVGDRVLLRTALQLTLLRPTSTHASLLGSHRPLRLLVRSAATAITLTPGAAAYVHSTLHWTPLCRRGSLRSTPSRSSLTDRLPKPRERHAFVFAWAMMARVTAMRLIRPHGSIRPVHVHSAIAACATWRSSWPISRLCSACVPRADGATQLSPLAFSVGRADCALHAPKLIPPRPSSRGPIKPCDDCPLAPRSVKRQST